MDTLQGRLDDWSGDPECEEDDEEESNDDRNSVGTGAAAYFSHYRLVVCLHTGAPGEGGQGGGGVEDVEDDGVVGG